MIATFVMISQTLDAQCQVLAHAAVQLVARVIILKPVYSATNCKLLAPVNISLSTLLFLMIMLFPKRVLACLHLMGHFV